MIRPIPEELRHLQHSIWTLPEIYHPLFHDKPPSINTIFELLHSGTEIKAFVDRNFCSHLSYLYDGNTIDSSNQDHTKYRRAAGIMSIMISCNIEPEPNIAMYELGDSLRDPHLLAEHINKFRVMNDQSPYDYIDLFTEKTNTFIARPISIPKYPIDDARRLIKKQLRLFDFNLNAVKKIAILKQKHDHNHLAAFQEFCNWQVNEYLVGSPALVFALMYFSPAAKKDMLKPGFAGIRNACWDLTFAQSYIGEWRKDPYSKHYMFVTFDERLQWILRHSMMIAYEKDNCNLSDIYFDRVFSLVKSLWGETSHKGRKVAELFASTQRITLDNSRHEITKLRDFSRIRPTLNQELLKSGFQINAKRKSKSSRRNRTKSL